MREASLALVRIDQAGRRLTGAAAYDGKNRPPGRSAQSSELGSRAVASCARGLLGRTRTRCPRWPSHGTARDALAFPARFRKSYGNRLLAALDPSAPAAPSALQGAAFEFPHL